MKYTELECTSNFSFLRGASHPEEIVDYASSLGYTEIAITDWNTMAGIVRAYAAGKVSGIRVLPASCLQLIDGPQLLVYPISLDGYTQLSGLLTTGNLRAEKGKCNLYKADVFEHLKDIRLIAVPPTSINAEFEFDPSFEKNLSIYRDVFGDRLYLAVTRRYLGDDAKQIFRLSQMSKRLSIPLVATNDVHYHNPERRQLQDVLTCIREKCTIQNAGYKLHQNAERHLKSPEEMKRLFLHYPEAIRATQEIVEACKFSLSELKYVYPEELTTDGRTPQEEIAFLAWQGAHEHYGEILPETVTKNILYELRFIEEMNYAAYFLTVYDIVRFARSQGILCQGRGSAANSTICYCLGITSVDPTKFDLLFERFISSARNEPPDIDVDFEHERREEVIQYIYNKYGRERAAIVATVTQERQRGSIRDVGKAMGLSVDVIKQISSSIWEFTPEFLEGKRIAEQGLNPLDPLLRKTLQLTEQLMGFPRQLGMHTGGFVITQGKLSDLCPLMNARMENRTTIEWNKDDIDALGFLKIDVLGLGMLTCIRKAFELAKKHYGLDWTLANIPQDDPAVYEMICHADTIGVFQIESRAQQSMLPRLKPRSFYDLVIEVAIVRPGPIQGDMVHPYLRRRNGEEKVEYPSPELEDILGRTLGVPLFQEQAMKIAIVAAGFTPAEADGLRRSMATFKAQGMVTKYEKKLIDGMMANGYTREYALRVFKQLEGFGSYGFPESHAASFALLVYISAWIKWYYPDVFCCAILNSLPMGFYQPAQLVTDARNHGVTVLAVDVNFSSWENTLEVKSGNHFSVRLGFRHVKSLREEDLKQVWEYGSMGVWAAEVSPDSYKPPRDHFTQSLDHSKPPPDTSKPRNRFNSINELRELGVSQAVLEKLADADAFNSMGLDRREALWEISTGNDRPVALFAGQSAADPSESSVVLPKMRTSEHVLFDYASTSLSLKAHPVSFVREKLSLLRILPTKGLATCRDGDMVKVAGLVLVRQRPGTAAGVCFITIEDETGVANLVVWESLFEEYRKPILQSRLLMVEGKLQIEGEVIHVIVQRCTDLTKLLRHLSVGFDEAPPVLTLARGDETSIPAHAQNIPDREGKQGDIFYKGRNFR
jgi:error-prone DNA polymerase